MRLRRIASGPVIAAILIALMLSIVSAAVYPVDDLYSTLNSRWNGTSTLAGRGFVPVRGNFVGSLSSANTSAVLLIVGPSRPFTRTEANAISVFVREGGLLVIADDFGSSNGLLDLLGVTLRFDGRLLIDSLFYRKQMEFAVISDFSSSQFSAGLDELVLGHGTVLNVTTGNNVKLLARSSPFSFLDSDMDSKKDPQEPSGPFPILAETQLGQGTILLFASPASFTNGLLGEADNVILADSIITYARQHLSRPLLDETHLESSVFTPAKLLAEGLVNSILEGNMQLSAKLGLAAFVMVVVTVRYMYRRPPTEHAEEVKSSRTAWPDNIEPTLRLHPSWDRRRLKYVANELEASMKWRRLSEGE